jgi:hypothetical protein
VETTYPLTGLYGPYLAEEGVDVEDWLSLDELERHLLVMEAHTHSLPADHPEVPSMILHAAVHVLAETRLAEQGPRQAKAMLKRHQQRQQSRHHAIHGLGEALILEHLGRAPTPAPTRKKKPTGKRERKSTPKQPLT